MTSLPCVLVSLRQMLSVLRHACRLLTSLFLLAQCMAPRAATLMRSLLQQRCIEAGHPEERQFGEWQEEDSPSCSHEDLTRLSHCPAVNGADRGA